MENVICNNCGKSNPTTNRYCNNCGFELPKVQAEVKTESLQQPITSKKKFNLKGIIGIIIGVGTFFAIQHFFFGVPSYDKAMMQVASELNKTCPVMIDKETRFDNAIALPENIFQYNYTLVNMEMALTDTLAMKSVLEPNIVNFVKTNPQMKVQRDYKTTVNYYYKDKNGIFLFLISVTPDKYE